MIDALLRFKLQRHGFTSSRSKVSGARVHYYHKAGKSEMPTIVLLHGIGSSASHYHDIMPRLSHVGYSVLAFDLPGHGESSELDGTLDPNSIAKVLVEIMDAIAPKKFILVGNSLGGALSLRYASEFPERVLGLILSSPALGFETQTDWIALQSQLKISSIQECEVFLRTIFYKIPIYFPLISSPFYRAITRKGVVELLNLTQVKDFHPPEGMTIFSGKILMVWGKEERLFPKKNLLWIRSNLLPHALYEEPENIGHCPHFDNPRWFAKRVIQFAGSLQ